LSGKKCCAKILRVVKQLPVGSFQFLPLLLLGQDHSPEVTGVEVHLPALDAKVIVNIDIGVNHRFHDNTY
jgi:hypothetical protein